MLGHLAPSSRRSYQPFGCPRVIEGASFAVVNRKGPGEQEKVKNLHVDPGNDCYG